MEVVGRRGEEQGFTVRRREELQETLLEFQQEFKDYSTNNFSFDILPDAGTCLSSIVFLSLSKNNLSGSIPQFLKLKQKGRPMKRSKNVRKMKAIAKAVSANEKSIEK
ncbi:hypothetical protein V8G54_037134, partial [Vigna mungo]